MESVNATNVTINFQRDYYNNYFQKEVLDRYEGAFAMQAFYKFGGGHYDVNRAGLFRIDSSLDLINNLSICKLHIKQIQNKRAS